MLLFTTSLVAVVALIGVEYELRAGQHAGFGRLAWAVPFVLGPYVIWTWTDVRAHLADELAAVGLLAVSVSLSVVDLPPAWLKLAIAAVLIPTEWRMVARGRAVLRRADDLAAARGQVADLERQRRELAAHVADLTRQLAESEEAGMGDVAALQGQVADLTRQLAAAASGGSGGGPAGEKPPWGTTPKSQTAWLVQEMRAGRTEWTGEMVADLMGLGAAKTGRDRLAAARRAFRPVWPVDDTDGDAKEA